jgi:hypothetical protein
MYLVWLTLWSYLSGLRMAAAAAKPTAWQDIQQLTFTRWCNEHLKKRGYAAFSCRVRWLLSLSVFVLICCDRTVCTSTTSPRI